MAAKGKARLKEKYLKEIKPALQKELGLTNHMAVTRLEKIVVNMGLGEATQNVKIMDPLIADLASIAGQKPVTTRAKKSIAAFKVREGMPIGAMVTLRGDTMYGSRSPDHHRFAPRARLPRRFAKSFDGAATTRWGCATSSSSRVDYARVDKMKGMNVTIVTTAKDVLGPLLRPAGLPSARRRKRPGEDWKKQTMSTTAKRVERCRKRFQPQAQSLQDLRKTRAIPA